MARRTVIVETHKRSTIKSIGYRVGAIIITFVVSYIKLGEIVSSVEITAGVAVGKSIFYYIYERFWSGITWGKEKKRIEK